MNNSKKVYEKWSKKDYQKSSKKVYSRGDRAITLIALIVTIIVLLILAGVTINLAVNNQGIFNKAKTATGAYKNASENEQTGLDEADKEIENYMPPIPGSTLSRKNAPIISVPDLKYADLDGDGIADGIIVADISKASTDTTTYKGGNPWGDNIGSFSYTKKETSELREYSENTYKYTNADGSTVDGTLVKCTNNTGIPKYYILSLADYDGNEHFWYKNGYMSDISPTTSEGFGEGKENTEKMIDIYNGVDHEETNADIWRITEDKGWFIPSKEEWAAFASYLNTTKTSTAPNYYINYGLSDGYWSSSQHYGHTASFVNFHYGYVFNTSLDKTYCLRLCATF